MCLVCPPFCLARPKWLKGPHRRKVTICILRPLRGSQTKPICGYVFLKAKEGEYYFLWHPRRRDLVFIYLLHLGRFPSRLRSFIHCMIVTAACIFPASFAIDFSPRDRQGPRCFLSRERRRRIISRFAKFPSCIAWGPTTDLNLIFLVRFSSRPSKGYATKPTKSIKINRFPQLRRARTSLPTPINNSEMNCARPRPRVKTRFKIQPHL